MTHIDIDGLDVIFPYPSAYPEQLSYMKQIKLSLDANSGPCVLEMPSGTGKTVCLLSLIIAYMSQKEDVGPLVYCTRTIPEMNQGIDELKRVHKIRLETTDSDYDKNFLAVSLARRALYCVHPESADLTKPEVDAKCRALTIRSADRHCDFFDHVLLRPRPGVYSLADLRNFGAVNGCCPYFLARRLIQEAQVVFASFAYTLDPGARKVLMKHITGNAIVVFDEAHNIDDVCCEFYSGWIDQRTLDKAAIGLNYTSSFADEVRSKERRKIQAAYDKMVEQLNSIEGDLAAPETMDLIRTPELSERLKKMAMPKSIRNVDDFLQASKKIVQFMTGFLNGSEMKPQEEASLHAAVRDIEESTGNEISILDKKVDKFSPSQVMEVIQQRTGITADELAFLPERLSHFLINNKVPDFEKYAPLIEVIEFGGYLSQASDGYTVFVEQKMDGPILQLACLDCSISFDVVIKTFKRIVITSGTLSPLNIYPKLLSFEPVASVDFSMSFSRKCLLPLIVSKGLINTPISSSYKLRSDPNVSKAYGQLLLEYCKIVPDGIVAFFPSYVYMNMLLKDWMNTGIMDDIATHKVVFVETSNPQETADALHNYRNMCDCGKGAVLMGVARGRVSEGIDFSDHYGRCCILFGLPVRNTQSIVVQARAEYIEAKLGITREDFLLFDAMRAASQCVGRLLRSKNDYGVVVLADKRYASDNSKEQLPHWIREFLDEQMPKGMSTDESVEKTRDFMVEMAQPFKLDIKNLKTTKDLLNVV